MKPTATPPPEEGTWSEFDLIRWIREQASAHPDVLLGIGDDCALLRTAGSVAVTTDTLVDGTHFDLTAHDPEQVGRKSIACSLSDVAAMGCRPIAAVVGVAVPRAASFELAQSLVAGMKKVADRYETALVGGDVASTRGPMSITVTLIGNPGDRTPITRSGARPGDRVMVTGAFGGSILGGHMTFDPRVREGLWLSRNAQVHSMIDVSDGLAADLGHILQESGVGAVVDETRIPVSRAAETRSGQTGECPLAHALRDGEDYELCFTLSPEQAETAAQEWPFPVALTEIGRIVKEPGLRLRTAAGKLRDAAAAGWSHRFGEAEGA